MDEDSDDDDEDVHLPKIEDVDDKDIKPTVMEPDDAKSGELTDGINRIRVCFGFLYFLLYFISFSFLFLCAH